MITLSMLGATVSFETKLSLVKVAAALPETSEILPLTTISVLSPRTDKSSVPSKPLLVIDTSAVTPSTSKDTT